MKKFLSLVMTLAMAVSLFAFAAPGAGAKSFTDDKDTQYKEAVNVISEIQVMEGRTADTFVPKDPLTRQAAAKIICNMILGPTTAKALPTNQNPFPDVAAGTEFAGYISYCAENGIISGYADGTFRPGDPLSGYAYLKMLLGALGYDAVRESYVGANWKVNVAKQALGIGLDNDLNGDLDASRTVTREEAALYAFNTIKADMVEYDEGNTVTLNGQTITVGGGKNAKVRVWTTSQTGTRNIDATRSNPNDLNSADIIQFGEYYFNRLVQNTAIRDEFGRPSTRWIYKGVEIGTYPEGVEKVYYGNKKVFDIFNDLQMPDSDQAAEFWVNGVDYGPIALERSNDDEINDYTKNVATDNGNQLIDGLVGNGTITEVYRNDDNNHVIICSRSVYAGKVTSVRGATSKKDAYVIIEAFGNAAETYTNAPQANWEDLEVDVPGGRRPRTINADSANREFETTAYSVDDVVWYTYSDKAGDLGIKEMGKLSALSGTVNKRISGDSVTINSTTYSYGKNYSFDAGIQETDLTNNTEVTVYLDSQNNILFVDDADFEVNNYAALTAIETHKGNLTYTLDDPDGVADAATSWNDDRAHLVFADGTERNVYLDSNYISNGSLKDWVVEGIVRYKKLDNGNYRLYEVSDTKQVANIQPGDFEILDKNAWFDHPDGGRINTDSNTIFVIQQEDDNFKVYTGRRNAPNVDNTNSEAIVYFSGTGTGRVAKLVYVRNALEVTPISTEVMFISGASASKVIRDSDYDDYREYQVVFGGEILTIGVREDATLTSPASRDGDVVVDGTAGAVDKAWAGAILNRINWDGDDHLKDSSYDDSKYPADFARGIKTTGNTSEIRIGTNDELISEDPNDYVVHDGRLMDVRNDVNVYYADTDGKITRLSGVGAIETDEDDFVYWTEDDGVITNLFIAAFEP